MLHTGMLFHGFLLANDFVFTPCDPCAANKNINGKQLTVTWVVNMKNMWSAWWHWLEQCWHPNILRWPTPIWQAPNVTLAQNCLAQTHLELVKLSTQGMMLRFPKTDTVKATQCEGHCDYFVSNSKKAVSQIVSPILLEKPDKKQLTKGNCHMHESCTNPTEKQPSEPVSCQHHISAWMHARSVWSSSRTWTKSVKDRTL